MRRGENEEKGARNGKERLGVESSALGGKRADKKEQDTAVGWIKRAEKVGVNLTEETAPKKTASRAREKNDRERRS